MPGHRNKAALADQRAADRAAAKVVRAAANPVEVATENDRLRRSVRGAHALVHVLTRRLVGLGTAVDVSREQWMALPPDESLKIDTDDSGNVSLIVEKREPKK